MCGNTFNIFWMTKNRAVEAGGEKMTSCGEQFEGIIGGVQYKLKWAQGNYHLEKERGGVEGGGCKGKNRVRKYSILGGEEVMICCVKAGVGFS